MTSPLFDKVLIAIRGEAASFAIRAAQRMGLQTVAVYSRAERQAEYVRLADSAWCLDPESRLDEPSPVVGRPSGDPLQPARILAIAQASGARAVHPGDGELARNLELAEGCRHNHLYFIGPSPSTLELIQSKTVTRFVVEEAQVPLVPGYHGLDQSTALLQAKAEEIGYPLLIRGDQDDGGAATRVATCATTLAAEIAAAQCALRRQGKPERLMLEHLIMDARHVDVPVFCDQHGNGVYFPERDRSLRRHQQSLVLESPSATLSERVRKTLGEAALRCARALQYRGAATVSFILDPHDGFYFIGLKPYLEVDSHLSELVTGQDLVEWQLRIACGEPLPCAQDSIPRLGHALEALIYAAISPSGTPGQQIPPTEHSRIMHWCRPQPSPQVQLRCLQPEGYDPHTRANPLMARLSVRDASRPWALNRLIGALLNTGVAGPETNLEMLYRLCAEPAFAESMITTTYADQHQGQITKAPSAPTDDILLMAACAWLCHPQHQQAARQDPSVARADEEPIQIRLELKGQTYDLDLVPTHSGLRTHFGGLATQLSGHWDGDQLHVDFGSHIDKCRGFCQNNLLWLFKDGSRYEFQIHDM